MVLELEFSKPIGHIACGRTILPVPMDVKCYNTSMCDYKEASSLSHGTANFL